MCSSDMKRNIVLEFMRLIQCAGCVYVYFFVVDFIGSLFHVLTILVQLLLEDLELLPFYNILLLHLGGHDDS